MKQTQHHPIGRAVLADQDKPKTATLPGLPGGVPLLPGTGKPLLPSDRLVPEGQEGKMDLFDGSDVEAAQALYQQYLEEADTREQRMEATRAVMMFALQIAAVNLGVR